MVDFDVLHRNSILLGEYVNYELGPVGSKPGVDGLIASAGVGGTGDLKLCIGFELGCESPEVSHFVGIEGILCKVEEENYLLLALGGDNYRFGFEILGSLTLRLMYLD